MITYRTNEQLTPVHAGQKNYHEVCANYLLHSAISSIDSGKGSLTGRAPTLRYIWICNSEQGKDYQDLVHILPCYSFCCCQNSIVFFVFYVY